jgi:hypothetical protein
MKAKTAACPPSKVTRRSVAKAAPYGIAPRPLPARCATVGDLRKAGGEIGAHADWKVVTAAHAARAT